MMFLSYTAILLLALCLLITYRDYACTADAYAAVDVLSESDSDFRLPSIRNTVRRILALKGVSSGSNSNVDLDEAYKQIQCKVDDQNCNRRVAKDDATAAQIQASDAKRAADAALAATGLATVGNGINYYGGPIMTSVPILVHFIWYGSWSGTAAANQMDIITKFVTNLGSTGGSGWWAIDVTYDNVAGATVAKTLSAGSAVFMSSSRYGTSLSDANIQSIVYDALGGTGTSAPPLTNSPNDIYLVLTSKDVTATSGFCTNYCGWHTHGNIRGTDIKYAFIGTLPRHSHDMT
jgi:hypothetical protein